MTNTPAKILIMAGGTGGHIFPGLAVAKSLAEQGWQVHWLGTAERMEAKLVPEHGFNISFIDIAGLRGKGLVSWLTLPFKLIRALYQAYQVLNKFKPDVVLGMGGYASAPGGLAAKLAGIPLVIHEQNAVAGMSNKMLAKIASKVLCAFPNAFERDFPVVGNPLRAEVIALLVNQSAETTAVDATAEQYNVLVVGGSLGAKVLNDTVPDALACLENEQVNVWHQSGQKNKQKVAENYHLKGISSDRIKVTEFIDDMAAAYAWADVVICRAGALTVSELAMAAKPAIFVPLPHAVDDHQTKNARFLVDQGAAVLLPQKQLTGTTLAQQLSDLIIHPETLKAMAKNAQAAAQPQATEQVVIICKECAHG
jgi:UDP-N-acetylglucosamine--N-acetylmuramyl-(pentapeptide) pyrophosphoryl-undecaprenol N-acetylglucosamine transferase